MSTVTSSQKRRSSGAKSRTVRIEDRIWKPFTEKAKKFGLSNTAYLKIILMKTNESPVDPDFLVGDVERVNMTPKHQDIAEKIMQQI